MVDFDPRARFAQAPTARLASVRPGGRPHLVPVVFAVSNDVVYTAVDAKPKTTRNLRRLNNIEHNPSVSLLVDYYDDDWRQLWWVRADGTATIHREGAVLRAGYDALKAKYPQYEHISLDGPVIAVAVAHWVGWHG